MILPCSLLLSGGAVGPHQSDPAAWNRPCGAGADGGRGHVHPGVCWLCGGPAGEHLPAQICEWPQGRGRGRVGGSVGKAFSLPERTCSSSFRPPWGLCALLPQMVRFQETIRGASSSSRRKKLAPLFSAPSGRGLLPAPSPLTFYLPPQVLKELFAAHLCPSWLRSGDVVSDVGKALPSSRVYCMCWQNKSPRV